MTSIRPPHLYYSNQIGFIRFLSPLLIAMFVDRFSNRLLKPGNKLYNWYNEFASWGCLLRDMCPALLNSWGVGRPNNWSDSSNSFIREVSLKFEQKTVPISRSVCLSACVNTNHSNSWKIFRSNNNQFRCPQSH